VLTITFVRMNSGSSGGFHLVAACVCVACACVGTGCAQEREGANPLEPGASVEPADIEGSVLDAVSADHRATLDTSAQELAGLLVAPVALAPAGDELRLVGLQVDDPNGNGRLDDRWYEPRLRTRDCAMDVDAPPVPYAAASFIPGDADEQFDGDTSFDAMEEMIDAETVVGIEVSLFDDATQRDALAATRVELYEAMGDFECDFGDFGDEVEDAGGPDAGEMADMLMGDMREVELYDVGFPGVAYETDGMQGTTLMTEYLVGDRVLLGVSVSTPGLGSDNPGGSPDPALLHLAIDAELAKLSAAGLT
jgi:hypothetical protein